MDKAEFDQFAREYQQVHQQNIRHFRESPDYFAEYKIVDAARVVGERLESSALAMLDFGAGVGNSVPHVRRHLPRARLTCLDVSEQSLAIAEQRFPGEAEYRAFEGGDLPFPDQAFDLVFTACVFHHIPHAEHAAILQEFRRVLRPGGVLVLFEHNPINPLTRKAVDTCPFDENAELIMPGAMRRRVGEAGFNRVNRRFRVFFPGFLRPLRVFERFMTWLPLGGQYYIAASRPD